MEYWIGDKVILIHTQEEGIIQEQVNAKEYLVEVKGVLFPVFEEHLQYPTYTFFTPKKAKQENKIQYHEPLVESNINALNFSFLPQFVDDKQNPQIAYFKIYLSNQSGKNLSFRYEQSCRNETLFGLETMLLGQQNLYLHDIPFDYLSDSLRLCLSWHSDEKKSYKQNHERKASRFIFKPKPQEMMNKIHLLLSGQESSLCIPIEAEKESVEKISAATLQLLKQKKTTTSSALKTPQALMQTGLSKYVIDVHIEKITNQYNRLSNYEILQLQLQEVEKYIDLALRDNLFSMIIIHGIGTGKLRHEIHTHLSKMSFVKKFHNHYHPLYGFGATEVFF